LARWWIACAIGVLAASAQAAGVAMVTDLQGKAVASIAGRSVDLTILADIDPGTKVELAAGATLVALYFDSGDEYVFKGPAAIEFRLAQPQVLTGATPERRSLESGTGGKPIRVKPGGMTQGAIVMRGIRPDARIQLMSLNRTRTLDAEPVFVWKELQPGQKYGFELRDDTGRAVYETEVSATSLKLPASIRLAPGTPYTWELSARLPDGHKYSSAAEFAVATADVRAEAEALRPAAASPLSTRIAYAAWLDQAGLKDEAKKYWKAAAAERPEDARLKSLAAP
jgi:hypothetical protein